jgi:hypothetical protein
MPHRDRTYSGVYALMVLFMIVLSTQCVEEYNPNIPTEDHLLVIDGSILQGNEQQTIVVTRSTSILNPEFIAVEGCQVIVTDDRNNSFYFEEESPGKYHAEIDSAYLVIGVKFKLSIETPDKQVYESAFEEMYDSPPIDSLYFVQESNSSDQAYPNENGVRLNVDVYAKEEFAGYYRWKIHDTWESRSSNSKIDKMLVGVKDTFITTYKYDTANLEYVRDKAIPIPEFAYFNKPDTFHICYLESELDEFFFSSTSNMVANSRKRVPLHFVPNGPKLSYRYSCLVSQYSLSENAFTYWQTKVTELTESGGLYAAQPSQNMSNIKNINNDQETVIGYFWVSALREKRVFFEGPYLGRAGCISQQFDIEDFFEQDPDSAFGVFRRIDSTYFPVYISNGNTYPPACFDCRYSGGTLNPPDFW